MFIEQAKSSEVPKGAIRLTKTEVFEYMTDLIKKWPDSKEIWALKHGNPILSSAVVLSNTLILSYYRQKLKLRSYGRFTLFLPVVIIPSVFSLAFQNSMTTKSIILLEDCPICIATQSMFIQMATGLVYPLMSTIGGTYMFAARMGTVAFKSNGSQLIKDFSMHVMKASRPFYNRLTVFVIGHMLLSYAITHYQTENFEYLRFKMLEQQKEELELLKKSKPIKN